MSGTMTPEQKAQTKDFMKYVGKAKYLDCRKAEAHSRGLCMACYQAARRSGDLEFYPTTAMLADPDTFARTMFRFFEDNLADIAIEFGYSLVKANSGQ